MEFAAIVTIVTTITLAITVHAEECDAKLKDAVVIPEQSTCELQSGFSFVKLVTPTGDAMTKFCSSAACMAVWNAAKSVGLSECTIRGKQLYADLLNPIETACKKGSGAISNATDDSHDYAHGSGHGSSSVEDSSDNDSMVKAPTNSTTMPTPAPTSAATSLSLTAVGAMVFSIAAAVC
uniref:Elicitin n=1 Tax=Globisporangium ultimum (strain ATCC 200006 / CBS 805.95 / DAOM BR144) TaxID=431595 RepID=K3WVC1_GLOUD